MNAVASGNYACSPLSRKPDKSLMQEWSRYTMQGFHYLRLYSYETLSCLVFPWVYYNIYKAG